MSTLDDLLDALADRIAARLRVPAAGPTHYHSEQLPPGVTARAFLDACRSGALPASKVGRRWVATSTDVDAWVRSQRPERHTQTSTDDEAVAASLRSNGLGRAG